MPQARVAGAARRLAELPTGVCVVGISPPPGYREHMAPLAHVVHYTDPGCPFAWNAEPLLRLLE